MFADAALLFIGDGSRDRRFMNLKGDLERVCLWVILFKNEDNGFEVDEEPLEVAWPVLRRFGSIVFELLFIVFKSDLSFCLLNVPISGGSKLNICWPGF